MVQLAVYCQSSAMLAGGPAIGLDCCAGWAGARVPLKYVIYSTRDKFSGLLGWGRRTRFVLLVIATYLNGVM